MFDWIDALFESDIFMPHGHCYLWGRQTLWLNVCADALIALAYLTIPAALFAFVKRRRDLAFPSIFVLFGLFIVLCGMTHVIAVWTIWTPVYRLAGVVKLLTGLVSAVTAYLTWRLIPIALRIPSPAALERANEQLRELNAELEQRVAERTARLDESNRELQSFAYVASHDLQEPLRMVTTYMQLLERKHSEQLDAGAAECVRFAVDGATRMRALIDDLLEYSRVGSHEATRAEVALDVPLDRALAQLAAQVAESGARIERGALPTLVVAVSPFTQVFQNLISNAIKYCGERPPWIQIAAERGEDDDGWTIEVSDHGLGIAGEHHERIFDVFQRLHTREQYPGTGIGLAVCKRVIERHGGRIWVESSAGAGARFRFWLPD